MMMPKAALVALLVASVAVTTALAQVTARQGTPTVTRFESPMILEVPLPDATRLPVGASVALSEDVQRFTCEDVSLPSLGLSVKHRQGERGGTLTLELAGAVHVPSSHDRLVEVGFVAKKGEAILGSAQTKRIDAEEDRTTKFRTLLRLDEARLREAFASEPRPLLEVTVTVAGNG